MLVSAAGPAAAHACNCRDALPCDRSCFVEPCATHDSLFCSGLGHAGPTPGRTWKQDGAQSGVLGALLDQECGGELASNGAGGPPRVQGKGFAGFGCMQHDATRILTQDLWVKMRRGSVNGGAKGWQGERCISTFLPLHLLRVSDVGPMHNNHMVAAARGLHGATSVPQQGPPLLNVTVCSVPRAGFPAFRAGQQDVDAQLQQLNGQFEIPYFVTRDAAEHKAIQVHFLILSFLRRKLGTFAKW